MRHHFHAPTTRFTNSYKSRNIRATPLHLTLKLYRMKPHIRFVSSCSDKKYKDFLLFCVSLGLIALGVENHNCDTPI